MPHIAAEPAWERANNTYGRIILVSVVVVAPQSQPRAHPVRARLARLARLGSARPLSILLVEDHADSADIFRRILIDLGHHVRLAATFSQACQTCRDARFKYDAILCDIGLPDGDGIDLVPLVREMHPTAKLIALTGYGMPDDLGRIERAGFDAHLLKPFHLPDLLALLEAA